ncbi:MAG TPA: hydantoinase/oxoprolinase family protein [Desulfatirhabdiaceae bacterium]|nr:hydantoinase/oxoprolinase family protein [Desulfatirhabdiaceae bacterium]
MIIGLDVGGTYTDVVLLGNDGIERAIKVPTDSGDLFHTVLSGLDQIVDHLELKQINRVVLSTTLTTNAIAQDKMPRVGMIVSAGPGIDPEYFRTNSDYHAVSGATDHRGREIEPIDPDEIIRISQRLQADGIRHVGVVAKFSTRNPQHESQIFDLIQSHFDKVFLGHRVSGNLNFPRRIATTYLNTAVYPIHKQFFQAVQNSLENKGICIPIHIMKPDGGTMVFSASVDHPAQTILSGPAASVMGSLAFAFDDEDTLVMDIGGTTTDIAVLVNRAPLLNPAGISMGSYKTLIRAIETHSIPVGGDSTVRIIDGQIRIGPDRNGSAMAFGGPEPTPTDAMHIVGCMKGGCREKSIAGFQKISQQLNCSVETAAFQVFDRTCRMIMTEAGNLVDRINQKPVYTIHELLEGYRVNPKKALILGGPAPCMAGHLEKVSGIQVGVTPRWDVANAIGAALARVTSEVILFADTQQGMATAPEESFYQNVDRNFGRDQAVAKAFELLHKKAVRLGAEEKELEMEVVEDQQFNMVRGFYTTGRNIRVRVQIKSGLIREYDTIAGILSKE